MKTFKQFIEEQSVRDQLGIDDPRTWTKFNQSLYGSGQGEESEDIDADDDFSDFAPKPKKPNDSTGFTYTGNWLTDFLQAWNAS